MNSMVSNIKTQVWNKKRKSMCTESVLICRVQKQGQYYLRQVLTRGREPFWLREPCNLHIFYCISVRAI